MANTLYVGTAEGSFATISDAVKAAVDGDIIIVKGGEYTLTNETVSINKALTVKAEGDVTVDQFGIGSGSANPQDIVIEGFTFKPTKCAVSSPARTCGIYQNGTNLTTLTVKDCTFDLTSPVAGTTGYGIHLDLNFSGTEKVTVDGCTFNGDGELVTSAMRASYQSSIEFTNNTVNDVSGHAVHLSLTGPVWEEFPAEPVVSFDGNTFTNVGSCAIFAADIKNNNVNFAVTDNTITNAQLNGGNQNWGAIRFGSGEANSLTVTGNTITNANVGVYQGVALKDGATGTVEISNNDMTLADRPTYGDPDTIFSASALNVYDNVNGTVSAGDAAGNTVLIAESADNIIVDAALTGNKGDIVVIGDKAYIVGTNAFTTISAAAAAANAIDGKVTIEIAAGDYVEAKPVVLSKKTFTEDDKTYVGGITIKAAADAEVNITGQFWINSGATDIKDVAFDGLNIECVEIANGYYTPIGINANGSVNASGISVTNCTLTSVATGDGIGTEGVQFGWGVNVDGAVITGNTITADCGIYTEGATNANMTVSGNTIYGREEKSTNTNYAGWAGIYITNVKDGVVISDNTISDTAYVAIRTTNGGAVITDNTITNVKDERVVRLGDGTVISGNTVDGNDLAGLYEAYEGTDLTVCGGIAGKDGDTVVINGKTYTVGTNAYSSFTNALSAVTDTTSKIEVIGSITEAGPAANTTITLNDDLTIAGGDITWTSLGGYVWFTKGENAAEDLAVTFDGVSFNGTEAKKAFYFGTDTVVDGNSALEFYNAMIMEGATVQVEAGSQLNVYRESLNIDGKLAVSGNADFKASEAELADRQVFIQYSQNINGEIELEDTLFASYQRIGLKGSGKVTADNSALEFGVGYDGVWYSNPIPNGYGDFNVSSADAVIELTNGSVLKASGNITNNGTILIDDSTFIANTHAVGNGTIPAANKSGVLTNNGSISATGSTLDVATLNNTGDVTVTDSKFTASGLVDIGEEASFTVSGDSSINVANLNSGKITILGGTTLTDTTITKAAAGTVRFEEGVVTFKGDNVITADHSAPENSDLVVTEGASLLITRYVLAYGRDITVNGLIEDATAYEDKAALEADGVKLSLKANSTSGFSISGYGTSVLDVTDAYVELGSSSWKTATGTYTWNFTNSFVNAASFGNCTAGGSDTASWVTTFDDSRLSANYIKSGIGMTQTFLNGSIGTVNSMRIDGELNIDATSELYVKAYQNNKKGTQSEHEDITGTVNIQGLLDLNASGNGNLGVELFGGEINVDGGTFKAGKNDIILDAESTLNVSNGGKIITEGKIINAGEVNLTDTAFEFGTIENSGSVKVSGNASVKAAVTGNAVEVLDGTAITDSNIGGQVYAFGKSTWQGTNTVSGIFSAGYYNTDAKDINVSITGKFNNSNMLVKGTETTSVVSIGAADAERTDFNGGQIGTFANSVLNITNADVDYSYMFLQGSANVSNSTLNIVGGTNTYFRLADAEDQVVVDNSIWNAGSHVCLGSYNAAVAGGYADVIIKGGSEFTAGNLALTTVEGTDYTVKLTVDGSTVNTSSVVNNSVAFNIGAGTEVFLNNGAKVNATGVVSNAGTITIDATSTITAADIKGEGSIVIDAENFEGGYKKIIDITSTAGALSDKVTVIGEGISAVHAADGDVYLTDAAVNTIYVNADWADKKTGDVTEEGYIIGYNATGSFGAVANMLATDGSDTTVKLLGDISSEQIVEFVYGEGDITFTADTPVTVKQEISGSDWVFDESFANTITIGENVTFEVGENASGLYVYYGPSVVVEGTITGGANWGCAYLYQGDHVVESTGTISTGRIQLGFATLTVNGDAESDRTAAHIDTNYLLVEGSTFTATDAIIEAGAIYDSNNGGMRWGASDFEFSNSKVTADTVTLGYADSTMDIDNSVFTAGTVNNNGTITVSGESTINIGTLSGTYVRFEDTTLVGDSKIGGNIRVYGDIVLDGTLDVKQTNFYGAATIKSGSEFTGSTTIVGVGSEFTLEEGATLNTRFFNVMSNADINGTMNLTHSDPRQKLIQIFEGGVANINSTADVTVEGHNALVHEGGVLNVNGKLDITKREANKNDPTRGGILFNEGEVNVSEGTVNGVRIENAGAINVSNSTFAFTGDVTLGDYITIDGFTAVADSARDVIVAMVEVGESKGKTFNISVAKNSTSATIYTQDFADGTYNATVIDSTTGDVFATTITVTNGTMTVADSDFTAGTLNVGNGTLEISGNSKVTSAVTGAVSFTDDTVLGTGSVLTVDGDVTAAGDLAFEFGGLASAKTLSVEGTLSIDNVTLPGSGESVTLVSDVTNASCNGLVINGLTAIDSVIGVDQQIYKTIIDDTGIVLVNDTANYTAMSGDIAAVTQTADTYTFSVDVSAITGGFGAYTYSFAATDAAGNALDLTFDGTSFTLSEVPAAGVINVTATVTDEAGFTYTTNAFAADVADYTAPEFTKGPEATVKANSVTITCSFTDVTGVTSYDIVFDGASYSFDAAGSDAKFTLNNIGEGKHTYTVTAYDAAGNKVTSEEQTVSISVAANIKSNGYSQIVAYDAGRGAIGYIYNDGETKPVWKGLWQWGADAADKAVAIGCFSGSTSKGDGVLVYNSANQSLWAWTDLGASGYAYKSYGYLKDGFTVEGIADLDGNGYDDLLVSYEDGTFGASIDGAKYVQLGSGVEVIGGANFGTDNDSLIVKNGENYELWSVNGTVGEWSTSTLAAVEDDWTIAAIGDFSGDGIDDIVVWQESTGYMYAWENGDADTKRWVGALDQSGWEIAAVGDYNGDGKEDLLLRETTTGWGGLGYWGGAYAGDWNDLGARIETDRNGTKFSVLA